ncbi:GLABROUS1 enhancer-binding protein-like 1 [Zingiber officinale]|uniref:GLABROUS1 enhancer-binding protein-like 1 n=1 Tax=Zingiber officinale TaxID=94328 RepID=UPI001C4AD481|nr:GLABROUS1 enhancer-binding protein-like 1 [Zingiber officinale]
MAPGTSFAVGGVDPSPAKRKRQRVRGDDSNSSQRSSKSDHVAILRAAIEFRNQTGENPTKAKMPAFYEFVKTSLAEPLSQEQISNRLRHIRHRFIHSDMDNTEDTVLKLAGQLWYEEKDMDKGKEEKTGPKSSKERRQKNSIAVDSNPHVEKRYSEQGVDNTVEKSHNKERRQKNSIAVEGYQNAEKEDNEKGKMGVGNTVEKNHQHKCSSKSITELDRNAEKESGKKNIKKTINNPQDFDAVEEENQEKKRGIQAEPKFSYLAHIVKDYWKTYGLSKTLLEIGIKNVDPQKAGFLEEKWEKQLQEEMRFQSEWRKTCGELLAMLLKAHKDSHVSGGHPTIVLRGE